MERLGKHDLLTRVAVGGMAELFLARSSAQHGFEKTVALKRILPAFAENEEFIRMFLAEAQLAAGLHHPNIAQVFDFGEEDGTYYFTMEFVRGQNLRQVLAAAARRSEGMPLASVLHIITSVAAGLHHAHQHRDGDGNALDIVHRDVSPSNVIVTYEGNVKLVDFGIAKAAALGPGTLSGSLKGKISYMSPEQCRGELVDRRSDIFSLATLLWELTTGRRLFPTESNDIALLQKVERARVPPPTKIIPGYPKALEAILLKAMSRDREDRYASALDFREAIEEFAHESRLAISSTRLAKYMDGLFPSEERPSTNTSSFPALRRDPPSSDGEVAVPVPVSLKRSGPRPAISAHRPPSETLVTHKDADTSPSNEALVEEDEDNKRGLWMYAGAAALLLLLGGGLTAIAMSPGDTSPQSIHATTPTDATTVEGSPSSNSPSTQASKNLVDASEAPHAPAALHEAASDDSQEKVADPAPPDPPAEPAPKVNDDIDSQEGDDAKPTHRAPHGRSHKRRRRHAQKHSDAPAEQPPSVQPTSPPKPTPTPDNKPSSSKKKKSSVFLPGRGDDGSKKKPQAKDFL